MSDNTFKFLSLVQLSLMVAGSLGAVTGIIVSALILAYWEYLSQTTNIYHLIKWLAIFSSFLIVAALISIYKRKYYV